MKCKCITNNHRRKSNYVEWSWWRNHLWKELQASLSFSTFALVNYISVKPYKPRSHCNILGMARQILRTAPTYTEVLAKAKFARKGTKFCWSPHRPTITVPMPKFQPCRTQNINSVIGVIINYLLTSLVRSVQVIYLTSVLARTKTSAASWGPYLKTSVRCFSSADLTYLRTSVRYLCSTDLTLGRLVVNIYLKS